MGTFIFILFLMLLGFTLKKIKIFPEQTSQVLNMFIIYISLPAIIINEVPKITFSSEVLIPIIMYLGRTTDTVDTIQTTLSIDVIKQLSEL